MNILILGSSGLIGSTIARVLSHSVKLKVNGVGRKELDQNLDFHYHKYNDLNQLNTLKESFFKFNPEVIINCAGLTKHLPLIKNPIEAIKINSIFPIALSELVEKFKCRLIHISSDCVFSGNKGNYLDSDSPDPIDLYGKTKALSEIISNKHLVLRTSTIGHELNTSYGLLNWFLSQKGNSEGYTKAFFSGLTTLELAKLIETEVLPRETMCGIYNISSQRISKYEILKIIKETYNLKTNLIENDSVVIDRSLNSSRFCNLTGYILKSWPEMIRNMYTDWKKYQKDV